MTQTNEPTDEAEIRSVIEKWVQAFHSKSVDAAMALHAPGIVSFDIVPPLRYVGVDAYSKPFEAAFAAFEGAIDLELRDLSLTVRDDIAFSFSLNRFVGTMTGGQKSDYWFRWTACFQKIDGKWLIMHDHTSLPTDFASGKAVQTLDP